MGLEQGTGDNSYAVRAVRVIKLVFPCDSQRFEAVEMILHYWELETPDQVVEALIGFVI